MECFYIPAIVAALIMLAMICDSLGRIANTLEAKQETPHATD